MGSLDEESESKLSDSTLGSKLLSLFYLISFSSTSLLAFSSTVSIIGFTSSFLVSFRLTNFYSTLIILTLLRSIDLPIASLVGITESNPLRGVLSGTLTYWSGVSGESSSFTSSLLSSLLIGVDNMLSIFSIIANYRDPGRNPPFVAFARLIGSFCTCVPPFSVLGSTFASSLLSPGIGLEIDWTDWGMCLEIGDYCSWGGSEVSGDFEVGAWGGSVWVGWLTPGDGNILDRQSIGAGLDSDDRGDPPLFLVNSLSTNSLSLASLLGVSMNTFNY